MNTKEFANKLMEELENSSQNFNYRVSEIAQNNELLTAIVVMPKDSEIGINIFADNFVEEYNDGRSIGEIAEMVTEIIDIATNEMPSIDSAKVAEAAADYNKAKDSIICMLVGNKNNPVLDQQYHQPAVDDLSYTYKIRLNNGEITIPVSYEMFKDWNVDADIFHENAMKNTERINPPVIQDMLTVWAEMMNIDNQSLEDMGFANGPELIVVSNTQHKIGAVSIMNPEVQNQLVDMCGGDFYILPSSIHEVLIIPAMDVENAADLAAMVQDVNSQEVLPQERLSDNVLAFDSETKSIIRAEALGKAEKSISFDDLQSDLLKKQKKELGNVGKDEKEQNVIR